MKVLKTVFRSIISIALIFLLSIANYAWAQETLLKNEDALIQSFNGTKAEYLQANMNCSGKIVDKFLNMESLLQLGEYVKNNLDITGKKQEQKEFSNATETTENKNLEEVYYILKNDSSEYRQITIWGKDKEGRLITIVLTSEKDILSDFEQTCIFIDFIENEEISSIKDTKEKIEELLKKINVETEISTCIIGTFEGQLSSKEIVDKVTIAIGAINGNKVEGLFESSIISVSVYTPNIENYIFTGDSKMNVNISMRYNEYENKTYIWVGTPIITIGY